MAMVTESITIPRVGPARVITANSPWGEHTYVLYESTWAMAEGDFHALRVALHEWADAYLPPSITKTLVVDSDEFLHVAHDGLVDVIPSLGLHFVDLIPDEGFPTADLRFSIQGWYYSRQTKIWYSHPYLRRFHKPLMRLLEITRRMVNHNACKTFYFDRKHLGQWQSWHHHTLNCFSSCRCVQNASTNIEDTIRNLRNTGMVYHLANPSKAHFKKERMLLYARLQTDPKKGSTGDTGKSEEHSNHAAFENNWTDHIETSVFPTFADNFLQGFLDERITSFANLSAPCLQGLHTLCESQAGGSISHNHSPASS
jgi:hypothetical protein